MHDWTRRGVMAGGAALTAGAALSAGAAFGQATPLGGLLSDGEDGLLSAGLIARRGGHEVALAACAGRRLPTREGGTPSAFTLEDPFRVASVSKMIATVGFMRVVDAGLVKLDDDASGPLGFKLRHPAFPDKPIKIRYLLSHTSGLRNGPSYPVPAGHALKEAFEPGGRHWDGGAWFGPPDKAPGDWFAYADVNFCLIAQMMERLLSERFDLFMTRAILSPMDLDAGYNWSGVTQGTRNLAAPGARWLDGRWTAQVDGTVPPAPVVDYPQPKDSPPVAEAGLKLGENGFLFSPQGGLRLSLRNMDRLAQMFRGGGSLFGTLTLGRDSVTLMETPVWRFDPAHPNGDTGEFGSGASPGVFGGYGLGMEIPQGRPGPGGDAFFGAETPDWRGHLGDAYGWMTGLFWNIKDGRTLVWALNGMRETGRPPGKRSALTPQEEAIIDIGLAAIAASPGSVHAAE
jgi:CubicO group peptidase (beta-lactamase class C family)